MKNKLLTLAGVLGLTFQAAALPIGTATLGGGAVQVLPPLVSPLVPDVNDLAHQLNGSLESRAYRNDSSNPFGLSGITFWYQLTMSSIVPSGDNANRLSLNGYLGFLVNAAYVAATGVAPDGYTFFADTVGFNISLAAGQQSAILLVRTSATGVKVALEKVQDGGQSDTFGFAPAVPDGGTTVVLLGGALTGLGLLRKKFLA